MKFTRREIAISATAGLLAFIIYTCMYAIRKPYTGLLFENETWLEKPLKVWLVMAQLLGYAISKWAGIKIIGNLKSNARASLLLSLLVIATIPLLLLPYVSNGARVLCFVFNGFPLGLIFGIVFSWLEGRRLTEFMGALLACTFIFSSGFVKTIGLNLVERYHWSEFEMPGYLALIAFLIAIPFTLLITKIPAPGELDIDQRSQRTNVNQITRKAIIRKFIIPISFWIIAYFMLTIIRDTRDNFAAEILRQQGVSDNSIFTRLETPISLLMLVVVSFLIFIKHHRIAIRTVSIIASFGLILTILSTLAWQKQLISATNWMFLTGAGVYFGYILMNICLFDRFIAYSKNTANAGFLLYLADAWGYMGSVGITVLKQISPPDISWTMWYSNLCISGSVIGIICFLVVEKNLIPSIKTKVHYV